MSQFEFLVMTERNIFAYKLFFVIKYSRFYFIFYVKIATPPPEKRHPLFPRNHPLKVEILSSPPPFLKIWLEAQLPPPPRAERGEGAHYVQ